MPTILTDAHLAILRAAADHPDALLIPPAHLLGAARTRMAARLVALGPAERVPVPADAPRWLADSDGSAVGLRLTAAGRDGAKAALAREGTPAGDKAPGEVDEGVHQPSAPELGRAPRPGSKAALLIEMLGRDDGATLDALGAALGWQPHAVRAALTRLRQGGTPVSRVAGEDGRSVYRLAPLADGQADRTVDPAPIRDGVA